MPATSAGCVRASQVISKLDRTQTADGLLRIRMQTNKYSHLRYNSLQINKRRMTSLLELMVFLAPPLRPDADRPCALRLAGAASTAELM